MRRPSREQERQVWWMLHGSDMRRLAVILTVGVAVIAALIALILSVNTTTGPMRLVPGQITAFHQADSEYGSRPYAVVRLDDGGTATLAAPVGPNCREGQRVMIGVTPTMLGPRYTPHRRLC